MVFRCERRLNESKVLDTSLTEGAAPPSHQATGRRRRRTPQWEEDKSSEEGGTAMVLLGRPTYSFGALFSHVKKKKKEKKHTLCHFTTPTRQIHPTPPHPRQLPPSVYCIFIVLIRTEQSYCPFDCDCHRGERKNKTKKAVTVSEFNISVLV